MYRPEFKITNKILKNIGLVEACREVIDNAPLVPYWEKKFREEAIQRTVHYGTHLEGNELSLQEAIKVYSRHRPRIIIKDITGAATYDYAIATNLTSWVKGFSFIKSLEYPADERIPIYLDEGADEDFFIYEKEE